MTGRAFGSTIDAEIQFLLLESGYNSPPCSLSDASTKHWLTGQSDPD